MIHHLIVRLRFPFIRPPPCVSFLSLFPLEDESAHTEGLYAGKPPPGVRVGRFAVDR